MDAHEFADELAYMVEVMADTSQAGQETPMDDAQVSETEGATFTVRLKDGSHFGVEVARLP